MTCNIERSELTETPCESTTTMNLFPTKENMKPQNLTTINFLAHYSTEENPDVANSSLIKSMVKEPKAAQFTIFYRGQVIVFDDFPAEKAKEIISFASKGISPVQNGSAYAFSQSQRSFSPSSFGTSDSCRPTSPNVNLIPSLDNTLVQGHPQAPSRPLVGDLLPIARKVSLHRFLEKRKDRISSKAPYQTSNPMATPRKPIETMPWLGLAAKSPQI